MIVKKGGTYHAAEDAQVMEAVEIALQEKHAEQGPATPWLIIEKFARDVIIESSEGMLAD